MMRVSCPHCHERFDVSHRAVLAEAARLAALRKTGDVADVGAEVNGNVLPAGDAGAGRERAEAVKRRAPGATLPRHQAPRP